MKRIAYILMICLLYTSKCMAAYVVSADSISDTLSVDQKVERYNDSIQKVQSKYFKQAHVRGAILDSIAKIKAPFDARDYIMQKRFLKKGMLNMYPQHWYQRLSFGAFTGIQTIAKRGNKDVDWALPAGLYARYEFNRLHSLRLSYQYVDYNIERRECDMKLNTLQLDYLFNLSNYFAGYNPSRVFNASIAVGGGYLHNTYLKESSSAFQGQLGVNLSFRLSPLSKFFLEPFVAFASDDIDRSEESNGHRYDIAYGLKAGISIDSYSSLQKTKATTNVRPNPFFVSVATGIASLPSNDDIYLGKEATSSTTLAVGKWFDDFIGLNLSGTMNISKNAKQALAGADLMLNVLNLFPSYKNSARKIFEWDLALGGKAGWQWRNIDETKAPIIEDNGYFKTTKLNNAVYGFSLSSPLLFSCTSSLAITIEPGINWMTYTVPYTNYSTYQKRICDPSYSITAGIRYNF